MKNIHLIPTDKPTRLYYNGTSYKDANSTMAMDWYISSAGYKPQHIYITSLEAIKDIRPYKGKWQLEQGLMLNKFPTYLTDLSECKLVIMTTDQELINDGVQAIDDEFLEWFMKNPNCEEVEVTYDVLKPFKSENKGYLIHCPDNEVLEEPKQETTLKELLLQLRNTPMTFVPKEEQKQHLIDMMRYDEELGLYDEPKQETLEEAAEKFAINIQTKAGTMSRENAIEWFKAGAKWQSTRMYTEKDLRDAYNYGIFAVPYGKTFDDWFKERKK